MKVELTVTTPAGGEMKPGAKFGDVEMAVEFAKARTTTEWFVTVDGQVAATGRAKGQVTYQ